MRSKLHKSQANCGSRNEFMVGYLYFYFAFAFHDAMSMRAAAMVLFILFLRFFSATFLGMFFGAKVLAKTDYRFSFFHFPVYILFTN